MNCLDFVLRVAVMQVAMCLRGNTIKAQHAYIYMFDVGSNLWVARGAANAYNACVSIVVVVGHYMVLIVQPYDRLTA